VLVDSRDWANEVNRAPVAYVAEELLTAPAMRGSTWVQENRSGDEFQHPYSYLLFLGRDAEGNYVPSSQLRDVYSQQRRDVHAPEDDEEPPSDAESSAEPKEE